MPLILNSETGNHVFESAKRPFAFDSIRQPLADLPIWILITETLHNFVGIDFKIIGQFDEMIRALYFSRFKNHFALPFRILRDEFILFCRAPTFVWDHLNLTVTPVEKIRVEIRGCFECVYNVLKFYRQWHGIL